MNSTSSNVAFLRKRTVFGEGLEMVVHCFVRRGAWGYQSCTAARAQGKGMRTAAQDIEHLKIVLYPMKLCPRMVIGTLPSVMHPAVCVGLGESSQPKISVMMGLLANAMPRKGCMNERPVCCECEWAQVQSCGCVHAGEQNGLSSVGTLAVTEDRVEPTRGTGMQVGVNERASKPRSGHSPPHCPL